MEERESSLLSRIATREALAMAEGRRRWARVLDVHQRACERVHGLLLAEPSVFPDRLLFSAASLVEEESACGGRIGLEEALQRLVVSDLYLAVACGQGVESAWKRFRGQYRRLIEATAARAGGEVEADELLSELFVGGARGGGRLQSYRGEGSLAGWIEILVRRRIELKRKRSRREESMDSTSVVEDRPSPLEQLLESEHVKVWQECLVKAVRVIDGDDRRLLRWVFFEGLRQKEAARRIGWHEVQVCRRLQRATAALMRTARECVRGRDPKWDTHEVPPRAAARVIGAAIEQVLLDSAPATRDGPAGGAS